LTVSKDRAIIAFHDIFDDRVGNLHKDILLFGVPIIDLIESELLGYIISGTLHKNFTLIVNHIYDALSAISNFVLRHGSTTDYDLDALSL
jgi:hypothetical protein